jgi:hypothetical protein
MGHFVRNKIEGLRHSYMLSARVREYTTFHE